MAEVGQRIHIEFITDYAKKNGEEAFCEAFALWVLQRGKLGEWTRAFFKEVASSGGANIKEEKDLVEVYMGEMIMANTARYFGHNETELTAWYSKEQRKEWMDKNNGKILNRTQAERKYGAMKVVMAMRKAEY